MLPLSVVLRATGTLVLRLLRLPLRIMHRFLAFIWSTKSSRDDPAIRLQASERRLSEVLREIQTAKENAGTQEEQLKQATSDNQTKDNTIRRLETDLQNALNSLRSAQTNLQTSQANSARYELALSQLQIKNEAVENQYIAAKALLEVRGRELHAAEVFLAKHDTFTDREVAEQMDGLNYDIVQIAMTIADNIMGEVEQREGEVSRMTSDEVGLAQATEEFRSWFGSTAADALRLADHQVDSLLLEIFLQACLCQFAANVISRWHFGRDPSSESLGTIFRSLQDNGKSPVRDNFLD